MTSNVSGGLPYWRLSAVYFFYFSVLGATLPFWNLYLKESLNFSVQQIGWFGFLVAIVRMIAPTFWGWLADKTQQRLNIIRLAALVAFICFLNTLWTTDFFWLLLVFQLFSLFWHAILSQFDVVTLGHLQDDRHYYSQIRLWGSVGFACAVVGLGQLFNLVDISYLPGLLSLMILLTFFSSFTIGERPLVICHQGSAKVLHVLKQPVVIAFLVTSFLVQFSHAAYYVFFSIFLEEHGYDKAQIGWLWALGVIVEVLLFM